jgi:AraC family transcriptional activator of pobA
MKNKIENVPSYGLYGESLVTIDPGLVHLEDIAVRSSDLGWVIKAHRHTRLLQILCIFESGVDISLNGERTNLKGNWLAVIPPGVVHGFRFEPNVNGFVLTIEESIIQAQQSNADAKASKLIPYQAQLVETETSDPLFLQFLAYIEQIKEESCQDRYERNEAMNALARLAIISLNRVIRKRHITKHLSGDESNTLAKFRDLLEQHYIDHWSVARYSESLHVSTSTLSRLCHAYTGLSPKAIIQQRLIAESKRRLKYTRQSIEDIAYTLGFKDQAYFSRFFKKLQNQTPGNYRKAEYQ